jgi:hypothetical protein
LIKQENRFLLPKKCGLNGWHTVVLALKIKNTIRKIKNHVAVSIFIVSLLLVFLG